MPSEVRLSFSSVAFFEPCRCFQRRAKLKLFNHAGGSFSSEIKKGLQSFELKTLKFGRDAEIRTRGLTHPKGARYQAAPRPVRRLVSREKSFCQIRDAR